MGEVPEGGEEDEGAAEGPGRRGRPERKGQKKGERSKQVRGLLPGEESGRREALGLCVLGRWQVVALPREPRGLPVLGGQQLLPRVRAERASRRLREPSCPLLKSERVLESRSQAPLRWRSLGHRGRTPLRAAAASAPTRE